MIEHDMNILVEKCNKAMLALIYGKDNVSDLFLEYDDELNKFCDKHNVPKDEADYVAKSIQMRNSYTSLTSDQVKGIFKGIL